MQKLSQIVAAAAVLACMPAGVLTAQDTPNTGQATPTAPVLTPAATAPAPAATAPPPPVTAPASAATAPPQPATVPGNRRHRTATHRSDSGTCRHGTGIRSTNCRSAQFDRDRTNDEEKVAGQDYTATGDREIYRQRYSTGALSQIGAEGVPAIHSVREIVTA
jgi:hypothetical protein